MMNETEIATAKRPVLMKYALEAGLDRESVFRMSVTDLQAAARRINRGDLGVPAKPRQSPEFGEAAKVRPADPATPVPAPFAVPAVTGSKFGDLGVALAAEITPIVGTAVRDELRAEFSAALENRPRVVELQIRNDDRAVKVDLGLTHRTFPEVLRRVICDIPVYLYGPPGSGKTHVAVQLARAVAANLGLEDLPYHSQSFGPASQMHELTGIPAINGHAAGRTPLWEAWEHGGILLLDELDAAPELFVAMNAGLGNGFMIFADGKRYQKHPNCRIVAAGNTIMGGATVQFTSRQRQDKATVDRFGFVEWAYDETLELAVAGMDQEKWVRHVQKLRRGLMSLGVSAPDILITPRASILGARELRAFPDTTWESLESAYIWRGTSDDDRRKVLTAAR